MKFNKVIVPFVCLLFLFDANSNVFAQYATVYPTNWWIGMKHNKIQLLIKGNDDQFNKEKISIRYPGITITKINQLDNGKYISADITIAANAKSGIVPISFSKGKSVHIVQWELKKRRSGNGSSFAQGVNSSDLVYLIMPDRFSNGDTTNDRIKGMRDQSLNRNEIYDRHGGDFQGIINHLDYLQNLGVTTVWMTPILENDEPNRTEHGYSFTNHYVIDPRLGGAKLYKALSDALHKRGMKLIQDAVYNHVGSKNIFVQDPPCKDWFHQWPKYTGTSYKDQPLYDPYASAIDKKIVSDGWFTQKMPDVNQSNPYFANYLIQHAIWCVEEFGVDGWRIDTYIYNDLPFMNRCNAELVKEYPHITMFGETWVHGTASQAYFTSNHLDIPFKSNLQGATDFQTLFDGIIPSLTQGFGWTEGVNKLYTTLSNDFLYKDANRNVIFLDNHDLTRFYSEMKEDVNKLKMGIAWLLTCRGIPQLYYGTEVLMKGVKDPDGWVRLDFPGGWSGDKKSAFTGQGLSDTAKDMLQYTSKLANFRKHSSAITSGKLMQYVPDDGLYVYFRYDKDQTIMCVMNTSNSEKKIDFNKYIERTNQFSKATEIITGQEYGNSFTIPSMKLWVLELKK